MIKKKKKDGQPFLPGCPKLGGKDVAVMEYKGNKGKLEGDKKGKKRRKKENVDLQFNT